MKLNLGGLFPRKSTLAVTGLGLSLPFIVAASPPVGTETLPLWAQLLIAATSPACMFALSVARSSAAAYLRAKGEAKLHDDDKTNDAQGAALVRASERLDDK